MQEKLYFSVKKPVKTENNQWKANPQKVNRVIPYTYTNNLYSVRFKAVLM